MQTVEVFLNRFPLRPLEEEEASPWLLQVQLDPPPEPEATYALLGRLARQVGPMVARFGTDLVSPSLPEGLALEGQVAGSGGSHAYRLLPQGRHPLDPARPGDREAQGLSFGWRDPLTSHFQGLPLASASGKDRDF
ncbi:MAG: hypothetical protein RMI36_10645 [Thermus sp.]|uniref:hypothetical protein n=1 Tax=Thermus sp. TaxID=275 RepID=UPI00298F0815|nr:hypothetical protein [Thermus sp.]MDW8018269.1 hypothetical protein [Thermus sp.]